MTEKTIVERLQFAERVLVGTADDIVALAKDAREEIEGWERSFDLYWKAIQRGTTAWREAHPGNDLVLPDTAHLVEWLVGEVAKLDKIERNTPAGEET